MKNELKGKNVIVRCDRSGVFFGEFQYLDGREIHLKNARKLHYWDGSSAVEELSLNGTSKPECCRFTVFVDDMIQTDAIQVIPCTEKSIKSIKSVKEWKQG